MVNFYRISHEKRTFIEITPPHVSEKSSYATEQLFVVLEDFLSKRTRHFEPRGVLSLEIVSTKEEGIRYILSVHSQGADTLQRHIASYLPEVRIKQVESPVAPLENSNGTQYSIIEFGQQRHYAYPLQQQTDISQSDLVAYLIGSVNKLQDDEATIVQLIISPHYSRWTRKLYNKILNKGYATIDHRVRSFMLSRIWVWIIGGLCMLADVKFGLSIMLILFVVDFFIDLRQPAPEISLPLQRLYEQILEKLSKPLFKTSMRLYIERDNASSISETYKGVSSSLATLAVPGFQGIKTKSEFPRSLQARFSKLKFNNRLPTLFNLHRDIYSAAEIADIYHFPYGTIKTEGVVRSRSRTLPATNAIKKGDFDVIFGQSNHHGKITPIGLTAADRERHMFVVGGTGSGKTTMLKYQIIQDIQNGKGVAIIDPHGDLAEELLEYIPEERKKDLIYLNPDDLDHPAGVNLLELPEGLTGNDLLREKDRVTESVVSVMRKIFSDDDSGGHRIEYVLRNTTQTALTLEKPTLFTIFRLLNDGKFAKAAINKLEDENLKMFWKDELGKAGSMQKVKMASGITAKIGRFLFSASARAMLGQEKSTINFNEVLDGKILICNFSKGRLGEDTSMLFGVTILAKLQLAALKRSEKKQVDRKPFYLYVDEFQNFATMSFTQMLSEARKYKVFLTIAEQSTQQQDDQKLVNIILANVGTVVAFRTGSPKDEELLLPLFEPQIEKGEISNLPAYNFYCRIVGVESQEPMSGETIVF